MQRVILILGFLFFTSGAFAVLTCAKVLAPGLLSSRHPVITLISGTDRIGSNSLIITQTIAGLLAKNPQVQINIVDLATLPSSLFKSDYFAPKSKAFQRSFFEPIARADGLIFIVPEYDGAVPGILSYFLNHLRVDFTGKQVSLVGVSAGKWGARSPLASFMGTLNHRKAVLMASQVNIENVESAIEGGHLAAPELMKRLEEQSKSLVSSINKSKGEESFESQKKWQLLLSMVALPTSPIQKAEVVFESGVSIQGRLSNVVADSNQLPAYVQFTGPTSLRADGVELQGQGPEVHNQGYGGPVGAVTNLPTNWSQLAPNALAELGVLPGKKKTFEYESGVSVAGTIEKLTFSDSGKLLIITFVKCTVKYEGAILFQPEWGAFDLAVGNSIVGLRY